MRKCGLFLLPQRPQSIDYNHAEEEEEEKQAQYERVTIDLAYIPSHVSELLAEIVVCVQTVK